MLVTNDEAQVPLKDLVEITAGPSGSLLDRLGAVPDGVPVVSPSNITDHHEVDTRSLRRLPQQDAAKLGRFALLEGDIVIVRQGSLGRLALIARKHEVWLYNSSCLRARLLDDRVLPEYLALYLSFPAVQEQLLSRAVPGTVQSLNSALLGDLPVAILPLKQQREIVKVATNIDELVQVHTNMIERLETLKLSIFDDFLGRV